MKTAKSILVLRLVTLVAAVCLDGASVIEAATSNVRTFGAKGDTKVISDGRIDAGSTILVSLSYEFVPSDHTKTILIVGAGPSGSNLVTSISSVIDPAHISLKTAASVTVQGAQVYWGTDDSLAIASANRALSNSGGHSSLSGRHLSESSYTAACQLDHDGRRRAKLLAAG